MSKKEQLRLLHQAIKADLSGEKYIKEWKWVPEASDKSWGRLAGISFHLGRAIPASTDEAVAFNIISDGFGPILLSREKEEDYRIAYVFPDEEPPNAPRALSDVFEPKGQQGSEPVAVNLKRLLSPEENGFNTSGSKTFPETLAELAHQALDDNKSRCYLICAERGAGKTAFINYLFSVYHALFFKKKVVWIRMDISRHVVHMLPRLPRLDDRSKPGSSLFDSCCSHALWIILEKYLRPSEESVSKKSDGASKKEKAGAYIDKELSYENFKNWTITEGRTFPSWLSGFSKQVIDNIDYYSTQEKKEAFHLLYDFMVSKGYAFIFVIDGLDAHAVALVEYESLRKWIEEIEGIIIGRAPNLWRPGLYLLCMREGTYEYYKKILARDQRNVALRMIWEISPVDPNKVIARRKELIKKNIKEKQKVWAERKKTALDPRMAEALIEMTQEAVKNILKEAKVETLIEDTAYTGHLRAILEFFREAVNVVMGIAERFFKRKGIVDWVAPPEEGEKAEIWWQNLQPYLRELRTKELPSKTYLLWSAATLSSIHHKKAPIGFLENSGTITILSPTGDMPLMPNPWGNLEPTADMLKKPSNTPTSHYFMIKPLIFQYLLSHNEGDGTNYREEPPEALIQEIVKNITLMFGYNAGMVYDYIKCMILERMLRFSRRSLGLIYEETAVVPSPVGEKATTEWITNPDYVEHTMQLSVVPANLVENFKRFPTPGTPLDPEKMQERFEMELEGSFSNMPRWEEVRPSHYLPRLFKAWGKFMALLKLMAKWLELRYQACSVFLSITTGSVPRFKPWFGFIDKLEENMKHTANRILDDIFRNQDRPGYEKILENLLNEYEEDIRRLSLG